jgi:hypothetical protein
MIDSHLKEADIRRIAASTRSDPADIRRMLRRPLRHPVKNLVASQAPIQFCPMCRAVHASTTTKPVAIKAWFEFWRIECLHCRIPFTSVATPSLLRRCNPAREYPEWFSQILPMPGSAARGSRLSPAGRWAFHFRRRLCLICYPCGSTYG